MFVCDASLPNDNIHMNIDHFVSRPQFCSTSPSGGPKGTGPPSPWGKLTPRRSDPWTMDKGS